MRCSDPLTDAGAVDDRGRHRTGDLNPAFRSNLHRQFVSDQPGALLHSTKAQAPGSRLRRQTDTVVAHAQRHGNRLPRQFDIDAGSAAVLERVVDGFLRDAVEVAGHGRAVNQYRPVAGKRARDPALR